MNERPTSILRAAQLMRHGQLSPTELVEQCLEAITRNEPQIHAWVTVDQQSALATAGKLDREADSGAWRGPLHGIPIGVKDIIDVAGLATRAGSPLRLEDQPAHQDAEIVARFRQAGAIILGKTVTTPFACMDPAETCNPFDPTRTPGGSSSGSAAAVATGMCLAALGTQTGGSIVRPATYCGVAGLKPTVAAWSTQGIVPVSFHLDHVGPIARSVTDLALVWHAIAATDSNSIGLVGASANQRPAGQAAADAVAVDCADPPQTRSDADQCAVGQRARQLHARHAQQELEVFAQVEMGECDNPCLVMPDVFFDPRWEAPMVPIVNSAIARLVVAGAEVQQTALPDDFDRIIAMHHRIMAAEVAAYHRQAYRDQPGAFAPKLATLIQEGLDLKAVAYAEALKHRQTFIQTMLVQLQPNTFWLTPATTSAAPARETTGDPSMNAPWSYCGFPTVSVPCGWTDRQLPVALQLIARPDAECELLQAARWCETVLN